MIDRAELAHFLRQRRAALQPEDVGLPRGPRRRTAGLRREEVAGLCHMSTDYYARLERERGPQPSRQMIAAIAQGLHLSVQERDHLYRLAGHEAPARHEPGEHIGPGLLRIFDRLTDTPAEIVTELGESLRQTPAAVALVGDARSYRGHSRSIAYRWFTDPSTRARYAADDHEYLSRLWVSVLREAAGHRGPGSRPAELANRLAAESEEFRALWATHEVGLRPSSVKRFDHPEVGIMELECQALHDAESGHNLLVYTAAPGSQSYEKLALLSVIGQQSLAAQIDEPPATRP